MKAQRAPRPGGGPRLRDGGRRNGDGGRPRRPRRGPGRVHGGGPRFVPGWAADARGAAIPVRSTFVVTVVVALGTVFSSHGQPHRTGPDALSWSLIALACLPLVLRFRHPVVVVYGV